jgi:hypothetical protein
MEKFRSELEYEADMPNEKVEVIVGNEKLDVVVTNSHSLRDSLLATFFGGFLGVILGICATQWHENNLKKDERRTLLESSEKSIDENIEIMGAIVDLKKDFLLINNLNSVFLESTSRARYEVLDDISLSENIDRFVFRLNSLEQGIRNYQGMYYNPFYNSDKKYLRKAEKLKMEIIDNAKLSIDDAKLLRSKVDVALVRLR